MNYFEKLAYLTDYTHNIKIDPNVLLSLQQEGYIKQGKITDYGNHKIQKYHAQLKERLSRSIMGIRDNFRFYYTALSTIDGVPEAQIIDFLLVQDYIQWELTDYGNHKLKYYPLPHVKAVQDEVFDRLVLEGITTEIKLEELTDSFYGTNLMKKTLKDLFLKELVTFNYNNLITNPIVHYIMTRLGFFELKITDKGKNTFSKVLDDFIERKRKQFDKLLVLEVS